MSLNFNNSNIFFNLSNNSYNGSLAVNSSNDLVILNDSNLGSIAVSNIKIGQSNNFIILQKQAGSNVIQMITSTGTVLGISSEAIFGSNAAFFASNTISESGTIFASNASVVGSNTGIFGSNLVVRLSNALYSNVNTFQNLIVVQNQVNSNTLSNLGNALFSSNVTITGSNTVGYINAGSEWLYNPTLGTYSSKRVLTLNAEVGNTVFPTVTSGTLQLRLDALTLPNGNVTTWTDQSTNALAFTSCNTPPVRVNSAINGMPGVLFQGTGFVKNDSYTTSFNSNNTLFYVVSNITGGLLMYKGSSALVWNTGIKMIWMGDSTYII